MEFRPVWPYAFPAPRKPGTEHSFY